MPANEVLSRLADIARGDMSDFVSFVEGVRLPIIDFAGAQRAGKFHLVKKLKYTDQGGVEFELYDKQAALVQLGKALGLERLTVTGADGGPIKTEHTERHDLTKLSTDQLRTLRSLLAEAKPDDSAGAE
jgi:hypothetical protein